MSYKFLWKGGKKGQRKRNRDLCLDSSQQDLWVGLQSVFLVNYWQDSSFIHIFRDCISELAHIFPAGPSGHVCLPSDFSHRCPEGGHFSWLHHYWAPSLYKLSSILFYKPRSCSPASLLYLYTSLFDISIKPQTRAQTTSSHWIVPWRPSSLSLCFLCPSLLWVWASRPPWMKEAVALSGK